MQRADREHPIVRMLNTPNMKAQIAAALPKHVTPERVIRVAITALRNEKIAACTPASLLACIMQSAQLGLELNDGLGRAYVVPFKGVATLIIGYQGMIDLAHRSGRVGDVSADPVFVDDAFEYERGLAPRLVHKPKLEARRDVELLRAVYGVATLTSTRERPFVVLSKGEVEAARKRGASGRGISTPWDTDYVAMAQKTAIRRLYKFLPKSVEMHRAEALDEAQDHGRIQTFDPVVADLVSEAAHREGVEALPEGGQPIEGSLADAVEQAAPTAATEAIRSAAKRVAGKDERKAAIERGEDPDA